MNKRNSVRFYQALAMFRSEKIIAFKEKMGIAFFIIGVVSFYGLYIYGMRQLEGWYALFLAIQGL